MGKFSIIAAAVLLSAASALAQTGVTDGKFKRADSNATGSVKLDMVSVTANRSETDVAKYAGQVSVLNQNDLVKSPSVIDAIGSVPGVMLGNDHGRQSASTTTSAALVIKVKRASSSNKTVSSARLRFFLIKFQPFAWITTC